MNKPSLKEFDITAKQYAKYQNYKWKRENRERRKDKFAHQFNQALISTIAIIFLLFVFIVARAVIINTISHVFGNGKLGSLFLFILAILIALFLLFVLTRHLIGKLIRPKLQSSKIHLPFKKLYIKLQSSIPKEPYYNNAKKYELQNEAYYTHIGNLQQRFPNIIEFNYNLQKYFKNIIDEIITFEHIAINNSIINEQLEQRRAIWLEMDGITFEREVASIYSAHGYEAKTTKATGEGGVDIRLWKDGVYSIAQCKNVCSQLDEFAVKKLLETMHKEKASKAILICSGGFTTKARVFAKRKPLELLDLNQFLNLVNTIYPQKYQLVNTILESSVSSSNTTYMFKVIGKTDILSSSNPVSLPDKISYCLFETRKEAKSTIRKLQRIDEIPLISSASYNIKEWWLEAVPANYFQKALYYIKVSEKEVKNTSDKKDKKNKKDGQREIWGADEYIQGSMWNGE